MFFVRMKIHNTQEGTNFNVSSLGESHRTPRVVVSPAPAGGGEENCRR
jgi:hypothetical protein